MSRISRAVIPTFEIFDVTTEKENFSMMLLRVFFAICGRCLYYIRSAQTLRGYNATEINARTTRGDVLMVQLIHEV